MQRRINLSEKETISTKTKNQKHKYNYTCTYTNKIIDKNFLTPSTPYICVKSLLYATLFAEVAKSLLISLVILSDADVLPFPSLLCPEQVVVVVQILHLIKEQVWRLLHNALLSCLLDRIKQ